MARGGVSVFSDLAVAPMEAGRLVGAGGMGTLGWASLPAFHGPVMGEWTDRANCAGIPTAGYDPWHDLTGGGFRYEWEAKGRCRACPVKEACRAYIDEVEGNCSPQLCYPAIWGGETPAERVARRMRGSSEILARARAGVKGEQP